MSLRPHHYAAAGLRPAGLRRGGAVHCRHVPAQAVRRRGAEENGGVGDRRQRGDPGFERRAGGAAGGRRDPRHRPPGAGGSARRRRGAGRVPGGPAGAVPDQAPGREGLRSRRRAGTAQSGRRHLLLHLGARLRVLLRRLLRAGAPARPVGEPGLLFHGLPLSACCWSADCVPCRTPASIPPSSASAPARCSFCRPPSCTSSSSSRVRCGCRRWRTKGASAS